MTENTWLECVSPAEMLESLSQQGSVRKFRLFACACCRSVWHLLDQRTRSAVVVAEGFADGVGTEAELEDAQRATEGAYDGLAHAPDLIRQSAIAAVNCAVQTKVPMWRAAVHAAGNTSNARAAELGVDDFEGRLAARRLLVPLLRDIFQHPFRQTELDLGCRTREVVDLARVIYDTSSFGRMHELAQKLRDAGCMNQAVFVHCDDIEHHVRGCWVIDLVLGRV
jgi:hypothetical protein